MRHSHLFGLILPLAITVTGCGPDTSSDSAFNPATDVSLSFNSFVISDTAGLPPTLPRTLFWDFYRGIEPDSEDGEATALATALRDHIDVFTGAVRADDDSAYRSVRNPLDLLHEVIASDTVDSFNEGRRLMRDSIAKGEPARFNTPANNALIVFTENPGNGNDEPTADQTWVYTLLDWTSNATLNKVFRAAQFVARQPSADQEEPVAEVASASWSGRFDGPSFSTSGYNQPEFVAASFTGRTRGNMELRQEFIGNKTDTLFLSGNTGIEVKTETPDCIRAVLDYVNQSLAIYTSDGEAPRLEDGTNNPEHCGIKTEPSMTYTTVTVAERQ